MQQRPDAAGMRHGASQIRVKADRVATVVSRLDAQVGSMVYTGSAAEQFRTAMARDLDLLKQTARILSQAADVLNQGAASVEADRTGFYQGGERV